MGEVADGGRGGARTPDRGGGEGVQCAGVVMHGRERLRRLHEPAQVVRRTGRGGGGVAQARERAAQAARQVSIHRQDASATRHGVEGRRQCSVRHRCAPAEHVVRRARATAGARRQREEFQGGQSAGDARRASCPSDGFRRSGRRGLVVAGEAGAGRRRDRMERRPQREAVDGVDFRRAEGGVEREGQGGAQRRRCDRREVARPSRRIGLRTAHARARNARAAELHGRVSRGRLPHPCADSGAADGAGGGRAGGGLAARESVRSHDVSRRRFWAPTGGRLHSGGGRMRKGGRQAGEAAVDARGRYDARQISAARPQYAVRRIRCAGQAQRRAHPSRRAVGHGSLGAGRRGKGRRSVCGRSGAQLSVRRAEPAYRLSAARDRRRRRLLALGESRAQLLFGRMLHGRTRVGGAA